MMKSLLIVLTFIALLTAKETFLNHQVVRLTPTLDQIPIIQELIEQYNLDVWSDHLNDIRLPPHLKNIFIDAGITQSVFIPDVQHLIDQSEAQILKAAPNDFFDTYRNTKDVLDWLDALIAQFPDLLSKEVIGKTYLGKDIVAINLKSSKGSNKPRIVYNAGQHAREWITVPTINWVLNEFVTGYGKNSTYTELVDAIDWTFVPILNVDGYDFTWTNNRMWRKTRKPNAGSSCVGVDPNRNWPYMWNRGGSSNDPCNDAYHGPSAGSESEPMAIANYVKNTPRVAGYIDIHAYSQLWMSPWGYTYTLPPDYAKMQETMRPIVAAILSTHGKTYRQGNIANTIYVASGSSVDYTYSIGVLYSFAVELRDTGQYGFILPANQIRPQGEEFLAAVLVMADHIKTEWYSK